MEITQEIKDLFELARTTFGAPVRTVELTDQNLCTALERAMLSYNQYVLNFIVEANWSNFYGKKVMTNSQLAFAFSTRTLDLSRDYSDYFSHLVGLQQHGTKWELKKDYFKIVPGQQSYVIPAGRQICNVLRFSVNTSDPAFLNETFGAYGGGTPMFQMGASAAAAWAGNGFGYFLPFYAFSNFSVALSSVQMKEMNSWLGCQVTYAVTAMETGEHIVHLSNVPGGLFDRLGGFGKIPFQCFCWYTYYDVAPGEEDDCAAANPDVYLSPDQIKLDMKHYWALNDAAKAVVTQIFLANAAETLAFIRGKFSGNINLLNSPLQMDYNMLIQFSKDEKTNAITELKERLQRLSPYEVAKRDADLVESITKIRKGTPLRPKII
jgi:hypothetical protein